jgi:hypothetical protein
MPVTNVGSNIFVDCSLPEDQKTRNARRLPSSLKLNNCHPKAVKKAHATTTDINLKICSSLLLPACYRSAICQI